MLFEQITTIITNICTYIDRLIQSKYKVDSQAVQKKKMAFEILEESAQDFIESNMPEVGAQLESGHSLPLSRVIKEIFSGSEKVTLSLLSKCTENAFSTPMLQNSNEIISTSLNLPIMQQGMPKIVHTDFIQSTEVKLVDSPIIDGQAASIKMNRALSELEKMALEFDDLFINQLPSAQQSSVTQDNPSIEFNNVFQGALRDLDSLNDVQMTSYEQPIYRFDESLWAQVVRETIQGTGNSQTSDQAVLDLSSYLFDSTLFSTELRRSTIADLLNEPDWLKVGKREFNLNEKEIFEVFAKTNVDQDSLHEYVEELADTLSEYNANELSDKILEIVNIAGAEESVEQLDVMPLIDKIEYFEFLKEMLPRSIVDSCQENGLDLANHAVYHALNDFIRHEEDGTWQRQEEIAYAEELAELKNLIEEKMQNENLSWYDAFRAVFYEPDTQDMNKDSLIHATILNAPNEADENAMLLEQIEAKVENEGLSWYDAFNAILYPNNLENDTEIENKVNVLNDDLFESNDNNPTCFNATNLSDEELIELNDVFSVMKSKLQQDEVFSEDLELVNKLMDYITTLYPAFDEQPISTNIEPFPNETEDSKTDEDMPETTLYELLQTLTRLPDDSLDYDDLFIQEDGILGLEGDEVDTPSIDVEECFEISGSWGQPSMALPEQESAIVDAF
ncbi:hypothetical protein [Candidatus Berkiella aquae]|uniref:Uncharacterized protein n=1 Tax=Candidatus Berkiella aquae TaxID=295108 RepID=A0A0Q9Z157_9GAMM|nr:hypothetical protein [Candidatus Berkiella aquae]MCS5711854.1 hypothetical protein [Candidatus Berkiella aquae]